MSNFKELRTLVLKSTLEYIRTLQENMPFAKLHKVAIKRNYTGIPYILKVHFTPLRFYKGPTLPPVFANQKKSEEDSLLQNGNCFFTISQLDLRKVSQELPTFGQQGKPVPAPGNLKEIPKRFLLL